MEPRNACFRKVFIRPVRETLYEKISEALSSSDVRVDNLKCSIVERTAREELWPCHRSGCLPVWFGWLVTNLHNMKDTTHRLSMAAQRWHPAVREAPHLGGLRSHGRISTAFEASALEAESLLTGRGVRD